MRSRSPGLVVDEASAQRAADRRLLDYLAGRVGRNRLLYRAAELLRRFPDPQDFAALPLRSRLGRRATCTMLVTFLMLHGYLHPGYDYLLDVGSAALRRELR